MSLAEEIEIIQFAQGIQLDVDLVERFRQLAEDQKCSLFLRLHSFVENVKPIAADSDQALADSALLENDVNAHVLNAFRRESGFGRTIYMPTGEYEPANRFLLHLFKVAYQRQLALEKGNPANWWYWDLSNPEVVQGILARHQKRVEEIYAHPSFRSEFVSLAKLWHKYMLLERARYKEPEPTPEPQTQFNFVTYTEITVAPVQQIDERYTRSIGALRHALENAFSIHYGIDAEQARKLVFDVLERHVRETYRTDLMGKEIASGD